MKGKIGKLLFFCLFLLFLFPASSFAEKVLVVDPGHGGKFGGTCGYSGKQTGYCEEDANLDIALKVRDALKGTDIKVYLTRTTDTEFAPYLRNDGGDFDVRMSKANGYAKGNNDNSVFVSIHHNASTNAFARGVETYYYDSVNHYSSAYPPDPMQLNYRDDSKRLAESVHPSIVEYSGFINRKIHGNMAFYVIRNAQMPSILVELGYMTNRQEEKLIKSSSNQQKMANAIAQGVKNYFKVFDVYDKNDKKLATFQSKEDAIQYAKKTSSAYRVFDKDKQKTIFAKQMNYSVQHKTKGEWEKFYDLDDAIRFAKYKTDSRVVSLNKGWTMWSNYISAKYDVVVGGEVVQSFYDYNYAQDFARHKSNSRVVRKNTNEVLWTNQSGVQVDRVLDVKKLSGERRYETAVEISKSMYPNGFPEGSERVVILTTGNDSADALSAGPLSGLFGKAPILLTKPTEFVEATKNEIVRLNPNKVIIIGGDQAVSTNIENEIIQVLGYETERISGENRYETNQQIVERLGGTNGVFVAYGKSYADALAVAPIAAANDWGIVLTDKNEISNEALALLKGKRVVIVGGPDVISDTVQTKIKSINSNTKRIYGVNRYETLSAILWEFKSLVKSDEILITTGTNFPDALAAAPLAVHTHSPLLLVRDDFPWHLESFLMDYADTEHVDKVTVIGGVVKDNIVNEIMRSLK
ncbi:cell wall-binding repeat-containing protein [Bacillus sp. JJ1533]|uniref:cell wall-binding repeat-containing protein n=1 Tax=Bacillus sp. JJ1533 TaxID=3122959 RepID=UPI002FFDA0A8